MSHDVFDHDDRIVHQNADGKYQREQRHPIQRVAVGVEDEQSKCQGYGNGQQHHAGLAPAQRQTDQQRHRNRGKKKMFQKFIRFVLRGLAIISRDRHLQVAWNYIAAQGIHFRQHIL